MASAPEQLQPRTPTTNQHVIGTTYAILVAFIWVISSELVQLVFEDSKFQKAYFVTYVSLSAFVILLAGFLKRSWRATWHHPPAALPSVELQPLDTQLLNSPPAPSPRSRVNFSIDDREAVDNPMQNPALDDVPKLNGPQVFRLALLIAPLYFLADWVFTIGLMKTTVSSSSTISSLSAFFSLMLGSRMGVERFTAVKLAAAILSTVGVYVISYIDGKSHGKESLRGDIVNVLAAFLYAVYTTYLKKKTDPPGSLSMAMLFGFIGLVVLIGATPGFLILHLLGSESFRFPPPKAALVLLINALVGTVLSDYLWAKSVVLTTPLIGTLALSLTVPVSVIYDSLLKSEKFSASYLLGSGMVVVSFILVNLDELMARRRTADETLNDNEDEYVNS